MMMHVHAEKYTVRSRHHIMVTLFIAAGLNMHKKVSQQRVSLGTYSTLELSEVSAGCILQSLQVSLKSGKYVCWCRVGCFFDWFEVSLASISQMLLFEASLTSISQMLLFEVSFASISQMLFIFILQSIT